MDEIKFKVWNGKKMFGEGSDYAIYANGGIFKCSTYEPYSAESECIVLLYTGLMDFYAGDIVETSHHIYDSGLVRRNQVCYKDCCWKLVAIGEDRTSDIPIGLYANYPESIKKIGNIYENPEFLKEKR